MPGSTLALDFALGLRVAQLVEDEFDQRREVEVLACTFPRAPARENDSSAVDQALHAIAGLENLLEEIPCPLR